jgi:transcriptional regulator with XRE-family HTH domain
MVGAMRRTSLSTEHAKQLAAIFRERRIERGFSMRQVAAQTGFNIATITGIEAGTNLSPLPDTLKAIARVLGLCVSDLYLVADWLPADELPTLRPYLRAKYRQLDEQAIAHLARYAEGLALQHGKYGPLDREGERA